MIEELKADYSPDTMRDVFDDAWKRASEAKAQGLGGRLEWKPLRCTRTLQANAAMWALLADISRQVEWYGEKLTPENWKDLFTACLKKQRSVVGIEGGFVVLGSRTSRMSKEEMSDLLELMHAFAAERDVKLSAPKWMSE